MDKLISVKATIEPSDNSGYAMWIRSQEDPLQVWWKWYRHGPQASEEAVVLGLAVKQTFPGMSRYQGDIQYSLKEHVVEISSDQLVQFGFSDPPAIA